jgi:hypothetical protein
MKVTLDVNALDIDKSQLVTEAQARGYDVISDRDRGRTRNERYHRSLEENSGDLCLERESIGCRLTAV